MFLLFRIFSCYGISKLHVSSYHPKILITVSGSHMEILKFINEICNFCACCAYTWWGRSPSIPVRDRMQVKVEMTVVTLAVNGGSDTHRHVAEVTCATQIVLCMRLP